MVEDEEAIKSLEHHPGFQMLMNRLKLQKAVLKSKLETGHHKDIREVDNLQNGIAWADWLQKQVDNVLARKRELAKVKPSQLQEQQFQLILSQIEGVGPQAQ